MFLTAIVRLFVCSGKKKIQMSIGWICARSYYVSSQCVMPSKSVDKPQTFQLSISIKCVSTHFICYFDISSLLMWKICDKNECSEERNDGLTKLGTIRHSLFINYYKEPKSIRIFCFFSFRCVVVLRTVVDIEK